MNVAANLKIAKRRIDDYLWRDPSQPLRQLRSFLKENIFKFDDAVIIGGLVRDLIFAGKTFFKSDIDIVILANQNEILQFAKTLHAAPNRFGGFSYQHPHWKIDFWALESTWASQQGLVKVDEFKDLLKCTFFDCDSAIYNLRNRKILVEENYLDRIKKRQLEVNLLPTPSLDGNLLRGVRRLILWNMTPGPRLIEFIQSNLDETAFERICLAEKQAFKNPFLHYYSGSEMLKSDLFGPIRRFPFAGQMSLQLCL